VFPVRCGLNSNILFGRNNVIVQATSRSHTKLRERTCSQHRTRRSQTENIRGLNLAAVKLTIVRIFLTSALAGGEWSGSSPGRFTPGERAPGTHWIGGWVDPRAGLDVKKRKFLTLPGLELGTRGRPARTQSLYRLRYSGSLLSQVG
jgi:hypothetical protein